MRQLERAIPKNTYTLSESEIAVIHAMAFYFSSGGSGMTKHAQDVCDRLTKQFNMHDAVGKIHVWSD